MTELVGEIIYRKRGDTAPDKITVFDPDAPSTPLDNTGFSYTLTINTDRNPSPSVGSVVAAIAGAPGGADGTVEFAWTPADADQEPGTYWYDIQQTDGGGRIKTIAKNKYIFHMDVTK